MTRLRSQNNIKRRSKNRRPRDRILIVSEGKKTEPLYFNDLKDHYQLNMVEVKGSGSTPTSVVRKAKKISEEERKINGDDFNYVYCIFDRDIHTDFERAKELANNYGIITICSWPCFEFWFHLHFGYSRKPFDTSGGKTSSKNCSDELKKLLPNYNKNAVGIFQLLIDRLEDAKKNSIKALKDAKDTQNPDPSTEIHKLVEYLQFLAAER